MEWIIKQVEDRIKNLENRIQALNEDETSTWCEGNIDAKEDEIAFLCVLLSSLEIQRDSA
jgi:hypothetical protein